MASCIGPTTQPKSLIHSIRSVALKSMQRRKSTDIFAT